LGARAPAVEAAAARVRAAAAALPGLLAPAAPPGHLPPGAPPGPTAAAAALPGLLAPAAPPGPLPPGAPPGPTADAAAPGPLAPAHGAGSEHAAAGTPRLTEDQALDLLAQIDDDLAREAALLLAEERLAGELPRVALPEQTSATGLVALAQDPVGQAIQLRRPIPRQPSGGAAIGAQFHARVALELAHHWGARAQQGVLDEDALAAPAVDAELEAAVGRLLAAWRESEWLSGRYRVSAVEAPIELDFMGHAVAARIDAVFEDRDGSLVVVDWKTERSRGGRAKPSHAGQIRFYQAALARSRGIDPASIRGYVHHVPENLSLEVSYDPAYMERLAAMWTAPVST
jgi:DNA helicase-2/ATP-dependent DNA helicase PcrA